MRILIGFDHLFDHLAADGTGLLGGQVAVVSLLQVYADFACGLHLELVHCIASFRNNNICYHC